MTLNPPRQARSRRTLDRLTQAALSLMARQGVERTSVSQIVREAGSSVGSFYARFEGKEDFVRFLEARVWEDATDRWDAAVSQIADRSITTPALVAGVVRLLVETGQADSDQRRVLGSASGSRERAQAFHRHVQGGVTSLLRERRAEFEHPFPERAIALGYGVISCSVDGLDDLRQGTGIDDNEALVGELSRLYLAYLGSSADVPRARTLSQREDSPGQAELAADSPPGRPDPSRPEPTVKPDAVDFFDVWG